MMSFKKCQCGERSAAVILLRDIPLYDVRWWEHACVHVERGSRLKTAQTTIKINKCIQTIERRFEPELEISGMPSRDRHGSQHLFLESFHLHQGPHTPPHCLA